MSVVAYVIADDSKTARACRADLVAYAGKVDSCFVDLRDHWLSPIESRPAASKMLAAVDEGDTVVVPSLHTLFRTLDEMETILASWSLNGVRLVVADIGLDTDESPAAFGWLLLFRQWHRSANSQAREICNSRYRKAGISLGNAPLGATGRRGLLRFDRRKLAVIRYVFHMRWKGMSRRRIADRLNVLTRKRCTIMTVKHYITSAKQAFGYCESRGWISHSGKFLLWPEHYMPKSMVWRGGSAPGRVYRSGKRA